MRKYCLFKVLFALIVFISFQAQGQEKRLALVIGNSSYSQADLKNPVNDAILISETLKSLGFDVIIDTNISNIEEFNEVVRKFGDLRGQYNVGFIYYAGHAVQIDNVNYLLATNEEYKTIYNVEDKALSVQKIMRYLTDRTEEVNVLILDACRDNPFEKNWNTSTRSLEGGGGLAKINPPTGSLIAYSTDPGNTAADGDDKNSLYCMSLSKNMLIENTSLDQVFRNVRAEVLAETENRQRPVEATQLTGEAFYLKKSSYLDEIKEIDSLIENEDFTAALVKVTSILTLAPNNMQALLRKGLISYNLFNNNYDGVELETAVNLYPNAPEVYLYRGRYYRVKYSFPDEKFKLAIEDFNKAIELDSTSTDGYYWRVKIKISQGKLDEALLDYSKTIELDPTNPTHYQNRADFYSDYLQDYNKALVDYSKAIELEPENIAYWYSRGKLYSENLLQNEAAIKDFEQILKISPDDIDAINYIGTIYEKQGDIEQAIKEYEKGIALENTRPESVAYCYSNRANLYEEQNKLNEALADYSKAIELDSKNPVRYQYRANFYADYLHDNNKALLDYTKAIELEPENIDIWYSRGLLFKENFLENESAIKDFEQVLKIAPENIDAINNIGLIYEKQGKLALAIKEYEKGIALETTNPESAAYCYSNRAAIYAKQNLLENALADYSKAIELDPKNTARYSSRADFYRDNLNLPYDALVDFSLALSLDSQSIYLWFQRGKLFSDKLNDHVSAIQDFEQILKLDSNDVGASNWIGVFYHRMGNDSMACIYYDNNIEKDVIYFNDSSLSYCGNIAWSYINRALQFQKESNLKLPLEYYNRAVILDPNETERYYWRGWFFASYLNKFDDAINDFSQAMQLDDKNPKWKLNRAMIYLQKGDKEMAKNDFDDAVKLSKQAVYCVAERAKYFSIIGEYKKADIDFENAIKNNASVRCLFHYKVEHLIRQNKIQEAINLAIETCSRFNSDTISYNQLGIVYFGDKQYLKALEAFQTAAAIMDYNTGYRTIEPDKEVVLLSDLYIKIAEIYKILEQNDLMCAYYHKAFSAIEDEIRPDKTEVKKLLKEQIGNYCNE